jgi:hypothetical protein
VTTYEYKVLDLSYSSGVLQRKDPDIATELNREAHEGWRLKQIIVPSKTLGESEKVVAILEREIQAG